MKKKFVLSISLILSLFAISLTYILISKQANSNEVTDIVYEDTSHENSALNIVYPQFSSEKYEYINIIIQDFVENLAFFYYDENYTDLEMKLTYKITYHQDNYLSIIFEGMGTVQTAVYPNHLFFALTIDIKNEKIVAFPDVYETADEVYDIIADNYNKQFVPRMLEKFMYSEDDPNYEKVKKDLSTMEMVRLSDDILFDPTKFFLTEDGIGLSTILSHVLGDHIEFEIPFEELEPYLKN